MFQDLPILAKGYDEVQAGAKGFRFRSEKANDEVYCQAQNEKVRGWRGVVLIPSSSICSRSVSVGGSSSSMRMEQ